MKDLQHSIKRIGKRVLIGAILLISVNILIYSLVAHYLLFIFSEITFYKLLLNISHL